jgi:hypothetical protein
MIMLFPSHLNPTRHPLMTLNPIPSLAMMNYGIRLVDKVVIIAKQQNLFIESITLFSYLFCAFLFVTGFFGY